MDGKDQRIGRKLLVEVHIFWHNRGGSLLNPLEHTMANIPIFEVLVLLGRPAAGKSEILEHLRNTELSNRIEKYHIGRMDVIDDFPMLWAWFEEDHILSKKFAKPRMHTDEDGYFKFPYLWNLLIERIGLDVGYNVSPKWLVGSDLGNSRCLLCTGIICRILSEKPAAL